MMGMQEISLDEDQKIFQKRYANVAKYFSVLSLGGIIFNRLFT